MSCSTFVGPNTSPVLVVSAIQHHASSIPAPVLHCLAVARSLGDGDVNEGVREELFWGRGRWGEGKEETQGGGTSKALLQIQSLPVGPPGATQMLLILWQPQN